MGGHDLKRNVPDIDDDFLTVIGIGPIIRNEAGIQIHPVIVAGRKPASQDITGYLVGTCSIDRADTFAVDRQAAREFTPYPRHLRAEAWMDFSCLVSRTAIIVCVQDVEDGIRRAD